MPTEAKAIVVCIMALCVLYYRYHETSTNENNPQCKDGLQLSVKERIGESFEFKNGKNSVNFSYNSDVDISCEGDRDRDKLILKKNGKLLYVTKASIILREHTEFVCIDTETKCQVSALISAAPIVGTINSDVLDDFRGYYIMKYTGRSFIVICLGAASSVLRMSKDGMRLRTQNYYQAAHDESEISWSEDPDLLVTEYICTDSNTALTTKATFRWVPHMYVHSEGGLIRPLYGYSREKHEERYRVAYGNFVEIFCTWPRSVKFIGIGKDEELLSKYANINTLVISKTITEESKFGCADSDSDYMRYVQIEVIPRMYVHIKGELINPIRVEDPNLPRMHYRVSYGNTVDIFCSWSRAVNLVGISKTDELKREFVNIDTVKIRHEIKETSVFGCADSESKYMRVYVQIEVDEEKPKDVHLDSKVKAEF